MHTLHECVQAAVCVEQYALRYGVRAAYSGSAAPRLVQLLKYLGIFYSHLVQMYPLLFNGYMVLHPTVGP